MGDGPGRRDHQQNGQRHGGPPGAWDVITHCGNTYYRDDVDRVKALSESGIHYVDIGTSGGVWGLDRGYCLMIGGEDQVVRRLRPIFEMVAPGVSAASRTPGREDEPTLAEHGYLHCGPAGAGHFVKIVHNGIEYGLMVAYAEGLNILILKNANAASARREADAETAPLENPSATGTTSTSPRWPRCGGAAA